MDRWVDGWIGERLDRIVDGWMGGRTDGRMDRQMGRGWIYEWIMDRYMKEFNKVAKTSK